ncbi:MAG: ABC transporter substrate-binding protein [Oscillospiraceae bacterium]|nr:ABC transporter substrate-binding protein [Oscillospiraceae bacterium]
MKKYFFFALTFAIFVIFTVSSCQNTPSAGNSADLVEYEEPLVFDNYGREIVLTAKPRKVLTLGPNCTELFVALGLTDYITGHSLADHSRGPLPEYAAEYARIPELTYSHATREAVIGSGADFIYGIDWEFGGAALDIEELAEYGITVYINAASNLEEQYREIFDIGRIFQVEDRAEAFTDDQKARIRAVQDKLSGQPPLKALVYDHGTSGVFTSGKNNFVSLLIALAGGQNIFDDITEQAWATVSFEEIIARDPDVIIINDYDVPPAEEKIAEIKNGVLAQLVCVTNERFVTIELESLLPGSRMAYTTEKLAAGFYPGLFD